ncbi:MAG: colanic acid biosynthesis acetyltransferase WcaF [Phycisphaerales bacterium]
MSAPGHETRSQTDPARSVALVRGATRAERAKETLWELVGQPLMRITFHNWYLARRALLRLFGATVHPTARIRPTARISHPARLSIGAHSTIGDHAVIFCLGPVDIGAHCTVSQYAHLCAAGYDYTQRDMPLIARPIHIEDDVWIAADVFVGPGVTIGARTVVGARSTVFHSLPPDSVCAGDNAKRLGERVLRGVNQPASTGAAR